MIKGNRIQILVICWISLLFKGYLKNSFRDTLLDTKKGYIKT